MKNITIIGMGKFGEAVLSSLVNQKVKNIFIIDNNKNLVNNCISNYGDLITGVAFDTMQKTFLEENGVKEMDVAIVAIGDIQSSVVTCLNLLDLNIKKVIVKAVNTYHERILRSIGITEVIQSDMIAAEAITKRAILSITKPFQVIDEIYVSIKIKVTNPEIDGETLASLKMINTSYYSVPYIQRNKKILNTDSKTEIKLNDELYIIVKNTSLNNLITKLTNEDNSKITTKLV